MTYFSDTVQTHINFGYAKAAQRLGTPFVQYRPNGTSTVLVNNNIVQELYFAFDRGSNFDFKEPLDYNVAKYYALVDLTSVQIGDYFWDNNNRTFFAANIEPLKPAEVILCNTTVSIYRPASSTSNGYGGNTTPELVMSGIPCSILPSTKGEANEAKTPGSVRAFWTEMRIPFIATIQPYDVVTDGFGRRFVISQNSLAKEGYYCTMGYMGA